MGSFAVLSNHSADSHVVRVPKEVPLNLTCSYSSDTFPPPMVTWYKEDIFVDVAGRYLSLDNPDSSTTYHCVVENQVGNVSVKALVQPIGECEG